MIVIVTTAYTVPPGGRGLNYSFAMSFRHRECTRSMRATPGSESMLCKCYTSYCYDLKGLLSGGSD